jgi:HD-GYP domain-containing protein (c-di-GMP phosphodiesterase class II)
LVQFRQIDAKNQPAAGPGFKKKQTLSFVKLANDNQKSHRTRPKTAHDENRRLLFDEALTYLNQTLSAIRNRKNFPVDSGLQLIRKLAEGNPDQDPALILALHKNDRFKFVLHHGVNVAVFAIKIAKYLGFTLENQVEIGLTGLLHDVGMAAIPDKIIYKQEQLNEDEIEVFRNRPNFSYKILQKCGFEYAYLAECAAQIHERIDGSGYPRGLKAAEIHEYAQILGLLDTFEALIHSRPQRDKLTPFAAIKKIINDSKERYQRKHLKALLNTFTVFPLHSYVRLNSDAIGKVIETYPDQPMRPKVRIVIDSQNQKVLTDRIIALPEDSLLHIVDSVSDEEIRHLSKA